MVGTPGIDAAVPPSGAGCVECDAAGGGGYTCGAAPGAGISAAAIPRPPSTPPCIGGLPATRSSRASNPARSGSGITRLRKPSPGRRWPRLLITRSASQSLDRQAVFRRTGSCTFTSCGAASRAILSAYGA